MAGIANHVGSILTFSDSAFACKNNGSSIILNFATKYFLDDGLSHFFKVMFTCTDPVSRQNMGLLASKLMIRLFKLYGDFNMEEMKDL